MDAESVHSRRIVYLVPALDHVCVRHRVDVFIPTLEEQGWHVEKWVIPRGFLRRARLFWRVRGADVVVVIRKLFRPGQMRVLRWCARRLVFDFDDALVYRDSRRRQQFSRLRSRWFGRMMRAADRAIAGNDYLARLAARFGGHADVIPTCVDDRRLTPAGAHQGGGKVIIGWIGSRSTLMYLESLKPVFEEIGNRYGASVALKVVCDAFPAPIGVEGIQKPWSLSDELEDLRSFDIGIMPLPDDPWTRGKCGFKILQYMAVGIPTIASPVGVNTTMIYDGETGFLPRDHDDWVRVLGMMIENVTFRESMGLLARNSLRGRYAVGDWSARYLRVIEDAAGSE
jgi:glycosyltransferase involved in cell wall biosynthesis